uniref:Putative secreted protein n=1 Tax=Rhipicephalus microplus TaxID=6941 RepID=A0A6G5A0P7_RHIMP
MYNLLITVYSIIRLLAVTTVILSDKLCLAKAYDQNVVALHAFESKCAQVHEMTCCNCVSKQSVIHSAKVFLCGTVI